MEPTILLSIDDVLIAALGARLDFDENDLEEHIQAPLERLKEGLNLAVALGASPKDFGSGIAKAKANVSKLEQDFEKGEVRLLSDIMKNGMEIERARIAPDDFVRDKCQDQQDKLAGMYKVGEILGLAPGPEPPSWEIELRDHDYKSLSASIESMKELNEKTDESIKLLLKKKGWSQAIIGLFEKLQSGVAIQELKDDEWQSLEKLRKDDLGSRITVTLGY